MELLLIYGIINGIILIYAYLLIIMQLLQISNLWKL